MKFKILKSKSTAQPYYWAIVASNGAILASSETYVIKADAEHAIGLVQAGAATAKVVDESSVAA